MPVNKTSSKNNVIKFRSIKIINAYSKPDYHVQNRTIITTTYDLNSVIKHKVEFNRFECCFIYNSDSVLK